jgi:hypothetical protein
MRIMGTRVSPLCRALYSARVVQKIRILFRNEELLDGEDVIFPDGQFIGPLDGPGRNAVLPCDECNGFTAANGMFHPRKGIGRSGRGKGKNCKNGKKT